MNGLQEAREAVFARIRRLWPWTCTEIKGCLAMHDALGNITYVNVLDHKRGAMVSVLSGSALMYFDAATLVMEKTDGVMTMVDDRTVLLLVP